MSTAAVLAGVGAALPPRVVTNDELAQHLDTSDDWIRSRTGIRQRRFADPGTTTGDLAAEAGAQALKSAGVTSVDLVVLATTTPDRSCPGTAPTVATRLGLGHVPAYDVAAVCSGFVYALSAAAGAIAAGIAKSVLVIGAETFTSIIDPADRGTAVIFGDGAGAVVLRAGDDDEPGALLGFDLGSDGSGVDLITVPERGGYFTMEGRKVFTKAVTHMAGSAGTVLDRIGWPARSVDWFVGHQANIRILNTTAESLGVELDHVLVHLDEVGNTSAASVPLALAAAAADGRLRPGDRVLMSAFGGGLTWGSTALTWPELTVDPVESGFFDVTTQGESMDMDISAVITEILVGKYEVDSAAIAPEAQFADLGLDSLVLAELSVLLTSRLGIQVGEEELAEAGSIGNAAGALADRIAAEATTV